MFLSSFEVLREWLIENKTFVNMIHLGSRAFAEISGEVVQTTAWVMNNYEINKYQPIFFRLIEGNESQKNKTLKKRESNYKDITVDDMKNIPGAPITYWLKGIHNFKRAKLAHYFLSGGRNKTHNNDLYVRYFWEVSLKEKNGLPMQMVESPENIMEMINM